MNDKELNEYKKWLESKGYDFEDDSLWMEDTITDHSWKDIIELINDYYNEQNEIEKHGTVNWQD